MARAVSTLLKKKQPRGDRGLESAALLAAALGLMERTGAENFSLRAAAREIGCDAAALIYHFGSREGLERAIADRLHAGIVPPPTSWSWRERLFDMARQYRAVAQAYPRTFPLLMRYWTTGPQDLRLCDETFAALSKSGIPDHLIPAAECGFYAALLGLCAGEAGGLTGRPGREALLEIKSTPGLAMMPKLMPAIRNLGADIVFETQIMVMLDGLEALARQKKAKPRAAGKSKQAEAGRKRS
ncbi:MAG: TetR/AcrR family transcriptional regulator [Deltaproteobacteria bacterium]